MFFSNKCWVISHTSLKVNFQMVKTNDSGLYRQYGCFVHSLQWRHSGHDSVSNNQPYGCLLNRLFRRRSKKTSKLRVIGLCVGNSPGPVNSPHKGPVTRKMFPFDDVIMYRRASAPDALASVLSGETFIMPSSWTILKLVEFEIALASGFFSLNPHKYHQRFFFISMEKY